MSLSIPQQANLARRSYDRLHIARLSPGRWVFNTPAELDASVWPFLVLYSINGSVAARQSSITTMVEEGDFLVLRNSAALEVGVQPGADVLVIRVPEDAIGPYHQSMASAHGHTISTLNGTASLVAHLLQGLAAQPDDYGSENPGRLAQHIVGLVALMCIDAGAADGAGRPSLLQKAKEYIEVNLGDFDLTPDRIAVAQNISTRTLHRLFESDSLTINGWTRGRRLEHCRVELVDSVYADLSVSSIGARWGLCDAAHFSRLFKSAFGMSPRAYRAAHSRQGTVLALETA